MELKRSKEIMFIVYIYRSELRAAASVHKAGADLKCNRAFSKIEGLFPLPAWNGVFLVCF